VLQKQIFENFVTIQTPFCIQMLTRMCLVLVVLDAALAWGQAPTYTAASVVNASDYTTGPFAPNSVLSVFGTNLSWSTQTLRSSDIANSTLPTQLANVAVYVDNWPAPLLYVSATQVNFLVPGNEISGDVPVRVVREGVTGPVVTISLADASPALFPLGNGYIIATHGADGSLITADSPAQGGEIIVVYATGLGRTEPNPSPGQIPMNPATIEGYSSLSVFLDGAPLPWYLIKYAGVTPGSVGLYQINIELPKPVDPDPQIMVTIGSQSSPLGLQLAVQ
jgi:uncharacterized protein (TIGR03437 family)